MEELLVRLKPLNERKGNKLKVYMIEGARFQVERGWYRVGGDFARRLEELHQDHYDPESPLAFDVCTEEEAMRLEEKERRQAANEKATVSQAAGVQRVSPRRAQLTNESGDLTTRDLRQLPNSAPEMIDGADEEDLEDDADLNEDDGRLTEVGRVTADKPTTTRPGKVRTKK